LFLGRFSSLGKKNLPLGLRAKSKGVFWA